MVCDCWFLAGNNFRRNRFRGRDSRNRLRLSRHRGGYSYWEGSDVRLRVGNWLNNRDSRHRGGGGDYRGGSHRFQDRRLDGRGRGRCLNNWGRCVRFRCRHLGRLFCSHAALSACLSRRLHTGATGVLRLGCRGGYRLGHWLNNLSGGFRFLDWRRFEWLGRRRWGYLSCNRDAIVSQNRRLFSTARRLSAGATGSFRTLFYGG